MIFQKLLEELTVKTWLIPDNLAWSRSNLKMYGTLEPLAGLFILTRLVAYPTANIGHLFVERSLISRAEPKDLDLSDRSWGGFFEGDSYAAILDLRIGARNFEAGC